jgi:hypothetical protein
MVGLSPAALARRIERHNERPGADPVRRAWGLIHAQDLKRWIATMSRPKATRRADAVRDDVRAIETGGRHHGR